MPVIVIDYTELQYTQVAGSAIPAIVTGKFVQILNGAQTYIVFSPKEFTKYHSHIVARFCLDRGLEGSWDEKKERYMITDRSWEILGGGKFERDVVRKALRLSGDSQAYGRFVERGLRETLVHVQDLAGYTITID